MPTTIDLSQPLSPRSLSYPGDRLIYRAIHADIGDPDALVSSLEAFDLHAGTHMDAPLHFTPEGASIAEIDLALLPAVVITVEGSRVEPWQIPDTCHNMAVLFCTGWQQHLGTRAYFEGFPAIAPDAARLLVDRGARLVGIDTPSVDAVADPAGYPSHHLLCGGGIPIVEGLVNLDRLESIAQAWLFCAFPLALEELEASPVRAVAVVLSD